MLGLDVVSFWSGVRTLGRTDGDDAGGELPCCGAEGLLDLFL
jgi:hypothetical protein